MLKIAHKYCQILQHETTDKSFSILNAFSNCSQHTSLRSCYCFNIFKPCRTVTSVFLKRFISRVRKCSTKFHLNSPFEFVRWGLLFGTPVNVVRVQQSFCWQRLFWRPRRICLHVQNFYLAAVGKEQTDWQWQGRDVAMAHSLSLTWLCLHLQKDAQGLDASAGVSFEEIQWRVFVQ